MAKSIVWFSLALLVGLIAGHAVEAGRTEVIEQPIAFNHKVHTKRIECWECHFRVPEEIADDVESLSDLAPYPINKLPKIPGVRDCLECHVDDLLDLRDTEPSADENRADTAKRVLFSYVDFDEDDEPIVKKEIPWRRLTAIRRTNANFSHRQHAILREIDCAECHGAIGETTSPPTAPLVPISMRWCLQCHEREGASTQCMACHR